MSSQGRTTPRWNIFYPSDFSQVSEIAFAHALKLALLAKAELSILHVAHQPEDVHWTDFPGVRRTLERWGILPAGSSREEVVGMGMNVKKIVSLHTDPVLAILDYLEKHLTNLIVLATHQREGLARWMHKAVAEPIARHAGEMTLFVPCGVAGFVSLDNGALTLRRIVIPVDTVLVRNLPLTRPLPSLARWAAPWPRLRSYMLGTTRRCLWCICQNERGGRGSRPSGAVRWWSRFSRSRPSALPIS